MKYEPIFKLPYSNIFITEMLFKSAYGDLGGISTIKNGKWELFLEKERIGTLSDLRYSRVVEGFDFGLLKEKSMKISESLISLKEYNLAQLSQKDFIKFLDNMSTIVCGFMNNYSQTEFFFFTKIESELQSFIKDRFSFEEVLSGSLNFSGWPVDKANLAEYLINISRLKFDLRKTLNEVWMGVDSVLSKTLEQLVLRTSRQDITNMTLDEIKMVFEGKIVKDVSERHVYSFITWDGRLNILSGAEAYKKIRELDNEIPKNEVIGNPACKGFVQGRAKIIPLSMNPQQYFSKMEKGDVLVSDTTGPEMMVVIEKAAAIVTDEGGLMSHAAIVAREFNIPCVVGTKYATTIFQDGDLVEVNANSGVVRKV